MDGDYNIIINNWRAYILPNPSIDYKYKMGGSD